MSTSRFFASYLKREKKMNWSGGYKNRFRITSEVRKTVFQQQSRIVLVDLVKHDVDNDTEQAIHAPGSKKQEFSPTLSITDTSNDKPIGTPFKNIPCGTSSDSEENEKDEISYTNYSPYSSDRETSIEHEGSTTTCQSIQIVEEYYKGSASNLDVKTQENINSSSGSSGNLLVGSTPDPPCPREDFHHSTQSLRFLTPIACSALDRQHELEGYSDSSYSTTFSKNKATVGNNSFSNTSIVINNSEAPVKVSCSTPVTTYVIPAQEKQLHFYSPSQKRVIENRVATIPQESQTNVPLTVMINAAPCVINQSFHYPTPNLSCLTPIIRRGNVIFSTEVGGQLASDDNFKLQNSQHSISIKTDSTTLPIDESETAPFRDTSVLRTPTQRESDKSRNQASSLKSIRIDVTPAQHKQVRFASTVPHQKMKVLVPYKSTHVEKISQMETAAPSQSTTYDMRRSMENSFERHALVSHSRQEEDQDTATTQGQPYQEETSTVQVFKPRPPPGKVLAVSSCTSPRPCVEKGKRTISAVRKRKRPLALPSHTESSDGRKFNSRKYRCGRIQYCHCCSVVRKLKIRDAETQTSP